MGRGPLDNGDEIRLSREADFIAANRLDNPVRRAKFVAAGIRSRRVVFHVARSGFAYHADRRGGCRAGEGREK